MVTTSAPARFKSWTPSRKKPMLSSTGGSSSTATTRFPLSSLPAREFSSGRAEGSRGGAARMRGGGGEARARAAAAMCSGVVPQQPPTILTPAWTSSAAFCPK